jgi:hypothetical protein
VTRQSPCHPYDHSRPNRFDISGACLIVVASRPEEAAWTVASRTLVNAVDRGTS